jgi:glutamine synthetase
MSVFLNPTENSCKRLGQMKAPGYISWSAENRSQLVRLPASQKEDRRAELRSPDPTANPYIAFTLMIRAGLYGIENKLELPAPTDMNLYKADDKILKTLKKLPSTLTEAKNIAFTDAFIRSCIPERVLQIFCK